MCKAIEDLINDSKAEGRNEGMAEGINMGKIDLMSELVRDNFISIKDAAACILRCLTDIDAFQSGH